MNLLESKFVKLNTLTPVFIQGKDVEYGQGFVRRDDQTAYSIDSDKLGQFLFEKTNDLTLVEKYVDTVEQNAKANKMKKFDFEGFLFKAGIYHHEHLKTYEKELIQAGVFKTIVNAPQANHFIRNRANQAFIPGSSLKGVIKTAVMYHLIQLKLNETGYNQAKSFIEGIDKKLDAFEKATEKESKRKKDIEKGKFAQDFQWFIFQNGNLKFKPELDFFRCVKVKDSGKLNGLNTKSAAILSLSHQQNEKAKIVEVKIQDGDIGVLIKDGDGVAVMVQNKRFEFKNKIYKRDLGLLQENVGRNIRLINCGGDKIDQYELLDFASEKPSQVQEEAIQGIKYKANLKKNDQGNFQEIPVETFEGGTMIQIVLDQFLLDDFKRKGYKIPFSNVEELFALVARFGEDVWNFEKEFFDSFTSQEIDSTPICDFYNKTDVSDKLRIGWGTGLSGMTMGILLKRADFADLRDRIFEKRKGFPAPKSRRVIFNGDEVVAPLGWMGFELLV